MVHTPGTCSLGGLDGSLVLGGVATAALKITRGVAMPWSYARCCRCTLCSGPSCTCEPGHSVDRSAGIEAVTCSSEKINLMNSRLKEDFIVHLSQDT